MAQAGGVRSIRALIGRIAPWLAVAPVKAGCAKCNLENGAVGITDIEGKIARVATREFGNDRVSRKKEEERENGG